MTDLEILTQAKEKINSPDKWIKGSFTKSDNNNTFIAFCMVGALMAAYNLSCDNYNHMIYLKNQTPYKILLKVIEKNNPEYTTDAISPFNDDPERTWEEVMKVYDEAIAEITEVK